MKLEQRMQRLTSNLITIHIRSKLTFGSLFILLVPEPPCYDEIGSFVARFYLAAQSGSTIFIPRGVVTFLGVWHPRQDWVQLIPRFDE
jgi:hypothetical protein